MQLVLDERSTDAQCRERTIVGRFRERRRGCGLVLPLEAVELYHARVLIADEHIAAPLVRTRLRRRGDDRARRLLILRLVVLADDTVLLNRVLREWIAATCVLAGDAAGSQIILEARAVDEQVHRVRRLAASLNGPEIRRVD